MIPSFLNTRLQKRENEGLLRKLTINDGLIDLTSHDYFGFARSLKGIQEGPGATGSRLLTGNHLLYEQLEEKIADFHKAECCIIYNSGYMANVGLISALGEASVTFLYDMEIHASIIDGIRLSKAKSFPFRHNDLNSLERRLKVASLPTFVLVESIYSISGDFAPLKNLSDLCLRYGSALIVDEAHATGFSGADGRGLVAELGLESQVFARIHTFSKVMGSHGACVLGSFILKEYLVNFSRALIYTTALPSFVLSSIQLSYEKLQKEAKTHQKRLKELIIHFQKKSGKTHAKSPIQTLMVPGRGKARLFSDKLKEMGLDVRALFSPTVKTGKECLRIVLHSFNSEEEIDRLFEGLK